MGIIHTVSTVSKGSELFNKQARLWIKQLCKQFDRCLWLTCVLSAQWPMSRHDSLHLQTQPPLLLCSGTTGFVAPVGTSKQSTVLQKIQSGQSFAVYHKLNCSFLNARSLLTESVCHRCKWPVFRIQWQVMARKDAINNIINSWNSLSGNLC